MYYWVKEQKDHKRLAKEARRLDPQARVRCFAYFLVILGIQATLHWHPGLFLGGRYDIFRPLLVLEFALLCHVAWRYISNVTVVAFYESGQGHRLLWAENQSAENVCLNLPDFVKHVLMLDFRRRLLYHGYVADGSRVVLDRYFRFRFVFSPDGSLDTQKFLVRGANPTMWHEVGLSQLLHYFANPDLALTESRDVFHYWMQEHAEAKRELKERNDLYARLQKSYEERQQVQRQLVAAQDTVRELTNSLLLATCALAVREQGGKTQQDVRVSLTFAHRARFCEALRNQRDALWVVTQLGKARVDPHLISAEFVRSLLNLSHDRWPAALSLQETNVERMREKEVSAAEGHPQPVTE